MRVLTVTWNVNEPLIDELQSEKTGGAILIRNLAQYIGERCESYLMIGSMKLSGGKYGNVYYVGTKNAEDIVSPSGNPKETKLLTMEAAFDKALESINPSIVNIHGKGDFAYYCIQKCMKEEIPCVYTEHLFIRRDASFGGYDNDVILEDKIYSLQGIKVIAVSSAMRDNILLQYPNINPHDISVILNGTDFQLISRDEELEKKYNPDNRRLLVCSGSIIDRKNQKQLINVFKELPSYIKNNIKIIFCGNDTTQGAFQKQIYDEGLSDYLVYAGAFSNKDMMQLYSIADGMVMPSLCEGLSVSVLEMLSFGKPVIMYEDVEGASDLYDEEVISFAKEHTDKAFADAIVKWYEKEWDESYIKEYVRYFSLDRMAEDYIQFYENFLQEAIDE
ncbi:MAG: glycosyltransferase family 4 protein [Lachnospiraceae bacterium]|nr:glycosyltransferase family 4 protein [Lachnospiraceae bacterium]